MHYLIDLAEIQSSGRSDKAGLQYFNQSLRTRANLGRSLTFKIGFQTGLEVVNGEETYLPGWAERTVVRGQRSLLHVWYWGMPLLQSPTQPVPPPLYSKSHILPSSLGPSIALFFLHECRWVLVTRQHWSPLLFTLSLQERALSFKMFLRSHHRPESLAWLIISWISMWTQSAAKQLLTLLYC